MSGLPSAPPQGGVLCSNCGAELAPDQRYCLSCGQPASPVRLAFLDVLQGERTLDGAAAYGTVLAAGAGYGSPMTPDGLTGSLRRYSGLLALVSVLLLCLIVGLLVGHWVTQRTSPAPSVIKVEGLQGLVGRPGVGEGSASTHAASSSVAKEEAEAAKEAAKETKQEKAPPPPPVKVSPTKLKKLSTSTGKQHQKELNELGAQPIETG